jgi:hypothetical protein
MKKINSKNSNEIKKNDCWTFFKITSEFVINYETLIFIWTCKSIFNSIIFKNQDTYMINFEINGKSISHEDLNIFDFVNINKEALGFTNYLSIKENFKSNF